MDPRVLQSRFLGGMLASALGDAIGELAFRHKNKDDLCEAIRDTPVLKYTDDTAMAIGIAEELCNNKDIDSESLGRTFKKNYENDPHRGYGPGPPKVFSLVDAGYSFVKAAGLLYNGNGSFGNGSAMRVTPVGLYFYNSADLVQKAHISSEVTHTHPLAKDGAAVLAKAISIAVTWKNNPDYSIKNFCDALSSVVSTPEFLDKLSSIYLLLNGAPSRREAAKILETNVTSHGSVPYAVYCFLKNMDSFEKCLLDAVLAGGDRDTIGAMACGISGTYLGVEQLPQNWLDKLENLAYIKVLSAKMASKP